MDSWRFLSFFFTVDVWILMAETLESSENAPEKTNGAAVHRGPRAEIDTSAPFESVKEAASRFGGIGFWKPSNASKLHQPEVYQNYKTYIY